MSTAPDWMRKPLSSGVSLVFAGAFVLLGGKAIATGVLGVGLSPVAAVLCVWDAVRRRGLLDFCAATMSVAVTAYYWVYVAIFEGA